jgi:hypothetical protein
MNASIRTCRSHQSPSLIRRTRTVTSLPSNAAASICCVVISAAEPKPRPAASLQNTAQLKQNRPHVSEETITGSVRRYWSQGSAKHC